jgi:nucleoside-diphosphate-sugar epimerase
MNRIVILGGSSFIGSKILSDIECMEISVLATTRKKVSPYSNSGSLVNWVQCDPILPGSLNTILEPADIVINLIYTGISELDNAIALNLILASETIMLSQIIHCSTACLGEVKHSKIISEDSTYYASTKYEIEKTNLESMLSKSIASSILTIVRPAVVFGKGGRNLSIFISRAKSKRHLANFLSIFFFGTRQMHLVPVDQVSQEIINLAGKDPLHCPDIILICNVNSLTMLEVLNEIYLSLYNKKLCSFTLPQWIGQSILKLARKVDPYYDKLFISKYLKSQKLSNNKKEHLLKLLKDFIASH